MATAATRKKAKSRKASARKAADTRRLKAVRPSLKPDELGLLVGGDGNLTAIRPAPGVEEAASEPTTE